MDDVEKGIQDLKRKNNKQDVQIVVLELQNKELVAENDELKLEIKRLAETHQSNQKLMESIEKLKVENSKISQSNQSNE